MEGFHCSRRHPLDKTCSPISVWSLRTRNGLSGKNKVHGVEIGHLQKKRLIITSGYWSGFEPFYANQDSQKTKQNGKLEFYSQSLCLYMKLSRQYKTVRLRISSGTHSLGMKLEISELVSDNQRAILLRPISKFHYFLKNHYRRIVRLNWRLFTGTLFLTASASERAVVLKLMNFPMTFLFRSIRHWSKGLTVVPVQYPVPLLSWNFNAQITTFGTNNFNSQVFGKQSGKA